MKKTMIVLCCVLGACRILGVVAMCLQVRAEMVRPAECLLALLTFVRPDVCMYSLVSLPSRCLGECPSAVLRLVRLLSSVNSFMILQS